MKQEKKDIKPKFYLRPAKITFRNVLAVIQAYLRKSMSGIYMPTYIYEQIIWRRIQVNIKSPMCWQSGSCVICGCDILGKTMEDRACSLSEHPDLKKEPCYPAMMNKKEWQEFKEIKKIKLFE